MAPMNQALQHANDAVRAGVGHLNERYHEVKPKLRGWLHLGSTPLILAAGIVTAGYVGLVGDEPSVQRAATMAAPTAPRGRASASISAAGWSRWARWSGCASARSSTCW